MKDMIEFGNRIKRLRQQQNFSLRELGERSGISYSFINSIENNRFSPSRETVIALARALPGSDMNDLLLLAGFAPEEDEFTSAHASDAAKADDPEVSLFFKDFQNAPKERRDEMLRFWHFIKQQQQGRTPDSQQ
ncbi:helix-turn-helix transcriptional regulator [Paenibacillus athensensis]|uniref:HTH cro/C1-type domain-containing protein n=1 Tax=Paenibacillus athensensis TaxID=1967502 RepID=A0A4Y8Q5F8_9BACL|nr:helix-turn-helix transcriptional regulator [Paenibacillus athensensis]MCD1259478.1 helix-turn-helix transcriptional regulator [Paenibacillus athensensis]